VRLRCCRLWNGVVGVSSRALLRNRAPRQKAALEPIPSRATQANRETTAL
jgi:hypothetical protein